MSNKPVPTHLKLLRGTKRKDRGSPREPTPGRGIPRCPAYITGRSRAAWKVVAPVLDRMGVLTHADGAALEALCDAYADYREAKKVIDKAGPVYSTTTPAGDIMYRPRPEVTMRDGAWARWVKMLVEFGMTPSARSKVSVEKAREDDETRFFGNG